jgi:RsiW-degrading membrane proteinase PrsW (M82 family)
MIAVLAHLFFHLPPEMLGANAVDAIWTGFVGPLVEEALKGAVVLFIALRYRREFESVLDGIIYGAMVGIGFAMNANIVSYLGSFLTRGYTGLSFTILLEGIFFGLNHALYSAIFGAGLGYARLSTKRWGRWVFPFAAYLLAVLSHALHNLALRSVAGLNLLTVGLTLTGVLIVALLVVYLLRRQHKCLQVELLDELPDELYQTVLRPAAKAKAQWRSLRRGGFRAWRKSRRLHQLCAEYAFKRMQARISPEEEGIATQAKALREEIRVLIEKDDLG